MANLVNIRNNNMQVNIFDAKTDLSKLIKMLETKEESSITIARHGKPVAVLVPFVQEIKNNRIGIAKGKAYFDDNFDFDTDNEVISRMFTEESL